MPRPLRAVIHPPYILLRTDATAHAQAHIQADAAVRFKPHRPLWRSR
jgi:hypothetical protein